MARIKGSKLLKKINKLMIIICLLSVICLSLLIIYNIEKDKKNKTHIKQFVVKKYNKKEEKVSLLIKSSTKQNSCAYSYSKVRDLKRLDFKAIKNNTCNINSKIQDYYIYFKDDNGLISKPYHIDNYLLETNIENHYYLVINQNLDLNKLIKYYGNGKISYEYDDKTVEISKGILTSKEAGTFTLKIFYNDDLIASSKIISTDVIVARPSTFNSQKKYLTCHAYNNEQAKLIDEIMFEKINDVGYQTRAAVVEAARFLTLDFPYKISYFYENGRVNNTGVNLADGEGRYYHRGLYLSEDKFSDIKYKVSGPAIWGCPLTNWEPDPPVYIKGNKMPNGLDCSGFVSWAILNGGFDVGDIGAGESASPNQLTDRGKYTPLTKEIIDSNTIKVGDLMNFSGHIALIIGIDQDHYYVAESLNTFGGVYVNTYKKKNINKTFTHVVLMDEYYKEDGKIENMW